MEFIVGTMTDVGTTRNINQDSFCVQILDTSQGDMAFAMVCDGMGGYSAGELASATVIEGFRNWICTELPRLCSDELTDQVIKEEWNEQIRKLNYKLYSYGCINHIKIGTTLTAVLVTEKRYYVVNVGDSRTYLLRTFAKQLTEDHSVVYEEYKKGLLTKEQVATDERNNILTRSIGVAPRVEGDFFFGNMTSEMAFFLCSDGMHHTLSEEFMEQNLAPTVLYSEERLNEILQQMAEEAKCKAEADNITAVVLAAYPER